jgi:hypothetical protein
MGLDDWSRTPQVWRSLGGIRHPDRRYGVGTTTCSTSRMDDHGQDQDRSQGQWRGILTACIMIRYNDHVQDQAGNQLLKNSEISSSIYSIGWRYIYSVDRRSCFPVSNFRINHAKARSKIHHSRLILLDAFHIQRCVQDCVHGRGNVHL